MTDRPGPAGSGKRAARAYQGSFEAVIALLLAIGAGYWADQEFGTAPRWILVGVVVGFAAMVLRIWRMRRLFEPGAAGETEEER